MTTAIAMSPALHRWRVRWLRQPATGRRTLPVLAGLPPAAVVDSTGTPGAAENTSPALPQSRQAQALPWMAPAEVSDTERTTDNVPSAV